ncbi:MAG: flagellar biosynthesis anti-sigma factor FlgM [Butyrivibrio sp.]|nr:flagellar biosynthesis anti-sigma factor FlgM [Butyrivibrio sp.]
MRIDAYNQIASVYSTQRKSGTSKAASVQNSDKIEISSFGRELQIAKQAVKAAPDVREDKVAEMKAKIASGNYDVSAEDLAEKLAAKYGTTVF